MDERLAEVLRDVELTEREERYLEWLSRMDGETVEVFAELFEKAKRPAVSGRWIAEWSDCYLQDFHHCSLCGQEALTMPGELYEELLTDYCHGCGADMRERK